MAIEMREAMSALTAVWHKRGHDLDFSIGVALGYATIGRIGFEGRYDYGAVGNVPNLASGDPARRRRAEGLRQARRGVRGRLARACRRLETEPL
jgi:hypothetical protein